MSATKMTWAEFSARYCKTQQAEPDGLAEVLRQQRSKFKPDGFFLAEAQLLDSSWCGQVVILPYGPNNTFKTIPAHPLSPRGLASDTSIAIGYILADEVPA
jgi:hypothetical protein